MEYFCTNCCKEKREDQGLLPAIKRYKSTRIDFVYNESINAGSPFMILSGKYGFIDANDEIPWYDQILMPEQVPSIVPKLVMQLREKNVSKIIFYGKAETTEGWSAYYSAIKSAASALDIPVKFRIVDMD